MKLPPEYKVTTLMDLRTQIHERVNTHEIGATFDAGGKLTAYGFKNGDVLEMSTEQYCAYKRLIFDSDPIRYFEGLEIRLPDKGQENDKGADRKSDSELRGLEAMSEGHRDSLSPTT